METLFQREGITIANLTEEVERAELQALFQSVVAEQGWRPNCDDLGGPAALSVCLGAFSEGRLAGGMEIRIPDQNRRLPLLSSWPDLATRSYGGPAELVLLALSPRYRAAPGLLWALCAEMWRYCVKNGITDLFVAVTDRNRRIYCRLGWQLEIIGPEREHWEEPCYPCRIGMQTAAEEVVARARRSPQFAGVVDQAYRA